MEEKLLEYWQGVWKRVVVVGGGVAGSLVAKSFQFDADVTLIDPKSTDNPEDVPPKQFDPTYLQDIWELICTCFCCRVPFGL